MWRLPTPGHPDYLVMKVFALATNSGQQSGDFYFGGMLCNWIFPKCSYSSQLRLHAARQPTADCAGSRAQYVKFRISLFILSGI